MSESAAPLLALTGVDKAFGRRLVIEGLSWRLAEGECAVVLGPSGSGKTVFLSMLLGFMEPDAGEIDASGLGEGDFFSHVAVMFQEDALLDDRTVEANLALALLERVDFLRGPFDPETAASIARALTDVGLDPAAVGGALPSTLSGGMRRRVALARALIRGPRVLIADEPTAGLDPQSASSVYELMARLIEAKGMSAVIITHDPECAAALGNPVYYFTPRAGELARMDAGSGAARPSRTDVLAWIERVRGEAAPGSPEPPAGPPSGPPALLARIGRAFGEGVDALGRAGLFLGSAAHIPRASMVMRHLQLWGVESVGLFALIFGLLGFVLQIQGEQALVDFGLSNRLPEFQARGLTRLAPFLAAILMAGRCGSAITAQAGWLSLSGQRRALITMRIDPDAALFPALFWSWALILPVLTCCGMLAAWTGALAYLLSPLSSAELSATAFIHDLPRSLTAVGMFGVALKGVLMAGGLAAIAYAGGAAAKRSILDVMGAITRGLVLSFIWISLIDTALGLVIPA